MLSSHEYHPCRCKCCCSCSHLYSYYDCCCNGVFFSLFFLLTVLVVVAAVAVVLMLLIYENANRDRVQETFCLLGVGINKSARSHNSLLISSHCHIHLRSWSCKRRTWRKNSSIAFLHLSQFLFAKSSYQSVTCLFTQPMIQQYDESDFQPLGLLLKLKPWVSRRPRA